MALQMLFAACLIIGSMSELLALQCVQIKVRFPHLNPEMTRLLTRTGPDMPSQCIRKKIRLDSLENLYKVPDTSTAEDLAMFAYEALRHIEVIFSSDLQPVYWDERKLDDFLNILNRKTQKLRECLGDRIPITKEAQEAESFVGTNVALNSYFQKMKEALKSEGYDDCAWEIIRKEVLYNLNWINHLVNRMTK
ncbi:interferon a3-like [Erpetoichthys calabaricus]|uniref:interferon a3-like n=1 Tax=Erpetoichthys calabaricus TaxID=27687 RepID=UPI002233ED86|nr:interferon a3-like [Erpetoichthys calabaricus]